MRSLREEFEFIRNPRSKILFFYGIFNFIFLSIINLAIGNIGFLIYALFVVIIYPLLYKIAPKGFLLMIFLICLAEETIVYFIGGGLHGVAKSLLHDYVRSIPIFLTHAFLWFRYMSKYRYDDGEIFILTGLHGFFWEIIISGMILNPILTPLFGGTPFILYGLLVLIPDRPLGEENIPTRKRAFLWFTYLVIEILVGLAVAILFP